MNVFRATRWRLTAWFVLTLAVILLVIGVAMFLTSRTVLFQDVNSDLESRASREVTVLAARVLERTRQGESTRGILLVRPSPLEAISMLWLIGRGSYSPGRRMWIRVD